MHYRRVLVVAVAAVTTVGLAAGCSSSKKSGGGGRGPITFVTGKDTSGVWPAIANQWNAAHPNEKVTIKQQSDIADQQHDDIVQHMQAKDPGYDIVQVDVIWTAEFAAKGWLEPLTGQYALDTSDACRTGQGGHIQRQAVCGADHLRWWAAVLPQGPGTDRAHELVRVDL